MMIWAAGILLPVLLYLSGLFVVFTPLPVLYQTGRRGSAFGLICISGALMIVSFLAYFFGRVAVAHPEGNSWLFLLPGSGFYPSLPVSLVQGFSILYALFLLLMGWGMGRLLQAPLTLEKTFFRAVIPALGIPLLLGALALYLGGIDFVAQLRGYFQGLVTSLIALNEKAGLSPDEIAFLRGYQDTVVATFLSLLPGLMVTSAIFIFWLQVVILRRWPMPPFMGAFGDLAQWRLDERAVWAAIAAGALYFLNLYVFQEPLAGVIALNLLLILLPVYFFQGLSILVFYVRKLRSPLSRGAVYLGVIFLFQPLALMLVSTGLFDLWVDFRRLKKTN